MSQHQQLSIIDVIRQRKNSDRRVLSAAERFDTEKREQRIFQVIVKYSGPVNEAALPQLLVSGRECDRHLRKRFREKLRPVQFLHNNRKAVLLEMHAHEQTGPDGPKTISAIVNRNPKKNTGDAVSYC